jgi:hypothetical protein
VTEHILFALREIIIKEHGNLLLNEPVMLGRRLRIVLTDGSIVDMRYPVKDEYSFHWQRKDGSIIRIDTAPYHPDINTYPNHKHYLSEENILPDDVTDPLNMPEINCRKFLDYISKML